MTDAGEKLFEAVVNDNADTALKLLQDAGGSCQAIDLAKRASAMPPVDNFGVGFGLVLNGPSETITVSRMNSYHLVINLPVAGLTQEACRK